MNATSLEKQKKGNLYVYKFATGSRTPEYQTPATSVTKRIISSSVWGGLRKSKPKPKPEKEKELEGKERKSVSSVEGILLSLVKSNEKSKVNNIIEGRKSTSNSEEIEGKITKDLLQGKGNGKGEGARKSVSHVENNVAYVGKFVEKARKSTGAKLENDMVSAIALLQVKVLVTDMPAFMQIQAFQCARNTYDSLEKFSAKHIAFNLKKLNIIEFRQIPQDHKYYTARICSTWDLWFFPFYLVQLNLMLTQLHEIVVTPKLLYTSTAFKELLLSLSLINYACMEFDKVYGPAWHCIVGSSFGSFVTHATGCFLYFSMEKLCILLFRTKVQRALQ